MLIQKRWTRRTWQFGLFSASVAMCAISARAEDGPPRIILTPPAAAPNQVPSAPNGQENPGSLDEKEFEWRGGAEGRLTGGPLHGVESYDADHKGWISKEQFLAVRAEVRRRLQGAAPNPADQARQLFWQLDGNRDGRLSGTEMKDYLRYDANHADRLYEDEFVAAYVKEHGGPAAPEVVGPKNDGNNALLEGVWIGQSRIEDGVARPAEDAKRMRFTFKGDKLYVLDGEREEDPTGIKIDATKAPKRIDLLVSGEAKPIPGIFEIQGDELKICVRVPAPGSEARPAEFSSKPGSGVNLVVLRRLKKDEKPAPTVDELESNATIDEGGSLLAKSMVAERFPCEIGSTRNVPGFPGNRAELAKKAQGYADRFVKVVEGYRAAGAKLQEGAKTLRDPVAAKFWSLAGQACDNRADENDAYRRRMALFSDNTIQTAEQLHERGRPIDLELVKISEAHEGLLKEAHKVVSGRIDGFP